MFCSFRGCGIPMAIVTERSHLKEIHQVRETGEEVEYLNPGCKKVFSTMKSLIIHSKSCAKPSSSARVSLDVSTQHEISNDSEWVQKNFTKLSNQHANRAVRARFFF